MSRVAVFLVTLVVFSRRIHQRDDAAIHEQYQWTLLNCLMSIYRRDLIRLVGLQHCQRRICRMLCLRKTRAIVPAVRRWSCLQVAWQVTTFHWWIIQTQPLIRKLIYCRQCHLDVYLPGNHMLCLFFLCLYVSVAIIFARRCATSNNVNYFLSFHDMSWDSAVAECKCNWCL